jgi:hypothetical protein
LVLELFVAAAILLRTVLCTGNVSRQEKGNQRMTEAKRKKFLVPLDDRYTVEDSV